MSFARFGCENSDVYVVGVSGGYYCCGCCFSEWCDEDAMRAGFYAEDVWLLVGHLVRHRFEGDVVPQSCFDQVLACIAEGR